MTLTTDELRSKAARSEEKFDILTEDWETVPEKRRRKLYGGVGQEARSVGLYTILTGDVTTGRQWLRRSSEWYLNARRARRGSVNEPQMLLWTLLTAVLSGDDGAMTTATESAADVENTDPEYFTHFDRCLAGLIGGDDEAVLAAAAELEANERSAAGELDYYTGLGAACEAIVRGDVARLDRALSEVLRRHEELVPKLGATMDDALVCVEATALSLLAKERGLPVESLDAVESEYVPPVLLG